MADLFTAPLSSITFDDVTTFVESLEASSALTETTVVELKARADGTNVGDAVAAMANTDGGVVLVGVSDGGSDAPRIVGIDRKDHDKIVTLLHAQLPRDAMPEVAAVALPDEADRIIVILRIDPDAPLHPVVTSAGRVLTRLPGAKAPADRETILRLVARDQRPATMSPFASAVPIDAPNHRLWTTDEDTGRALVLRVRGGVDLPPSALDRPWLDTAAKDAATEALVASALPDRLWESPRHSTVTNVGWARTEQRAVFARYECPANKNRLEYPFRTPVSGAMWLAHHGRHLDVLLAVAAEPEDPNAVVRLELSEVFEAVTELMRTVVDVGAQVAKALGAGGPSGQRPLAGWLQPNGPTVNETLLPPRNAYRDEAEENPMPMYGWPASAPRTWDDDGIDDLARSWLTLLLLDLGGDDYANEISRLIRRPRLRRDT